MYIPITTSSYTSVGLHSRVRGGGSSLPIQISDPNLTIPNVLIRKSINICITEYTHNKINKNRNFSILIFPQVSYSHFRVQGFNQLKILFPVFY